MDYLICEECGGYYELQSGESADDFENCQCGGNLKFAELGKNLDDSNTHFNEKTNYYCVNCGNYDYNDLYCSKCGAKLINIENLDMIEFNKESANFKNKYSADFKKERKISNISFEEQYPDQIPKSILEQINVLSIIVGLGFYFIGIIVSSYIIYPFIFHIDWIFIVYNFAIFFISIISGAITAYVCKKWEYEYVLINSGILGFTMGLLFLIIIGFDILVINTVISTILGAIAFIFIKRSWLL
jgi:hypothetical protein